MGSLLILMYDNIRQFFRRVVANELGVPHRFDYDADPFEENVEQTIAKLSRGNHQLTMARVAA